MRVIAFTASLRRGQGKAYYRYTESESLEGRSASQMSLASSASLSAMRVRIGVMLSSSVEGTIPLADEGVACIMEEGKEAGGLTPFMTLQLRYRLSTPTYRTSSSWPPGASFDSLSGGLSA